MNEVSVFPYKKNVTNGWKDETQKNSPAVVVFSLKTYSLQADKYT